MEDEIREEPLTPYVCQYRFNGEICQFVVEAKDAVEARARLDQMPWGRVIMPLYGEAELRGEMTWLDRLVVWFLTRALGAKNKKL